MIYRKTDLLRIMLICFCMLCTLCSCADTPVSHTDSSSSVASVRQKSNTVCLPYSKKDVINPYSAETKQNQELAMMLYDPLIKVDNNFKAVLFAAKSYSTEQNKCTVILKSISFTDGTPLSADDVIYSYERAKSSRSYSSQLASLSSAYAVDGSTVVFVSKHNDPYMINILDFPIIKSGTANLKDSNNRYIPPIGFGRYVFKDDDDLCLIANATYYNGTVSATEINLIDCPDDDSLGHYLSSGRISFTYTDMSDGTVPKKSGKIKCVNSSNLVFLGVNCSKAVLSDAKARIALSYGIDRGTICGSDYFGYAEAATAIFPKSWSETNNIESINLDQNIEQAVAYFEEIGYNAKNGDGILTDKNGNALSFSLLYCSGNSIKKNVAERIASDFGKCGIKVILRELPYESYLSELYYGNFDLYIGEIKLPKSMYLGNALDKNVVYGFPEASDSKAMFAGYYNGECEIEAPISSFASEMPFIPICFKSGVTVASDWLAKYSRFSLSDIYNGIENYK